MRSTRVDQLMNRPPVTCNVGDTLQVAAGLMWEHDCGVIPVLDHGALAGILTDRDICMAAYTHGRSLREIPVAIVMTTEVASCSSNETVDAAERRMSERQVRRVPILDGDKRIVGVLSLSDIARDAQGAPAGEGSRRALVRTLEAICQPRPCP